MPLEQSANLFFFLPKLGMADPLTTIPEVIQCFLDFFNREAGERFLKRTFELLSLSLHASLADVKAWLAHSLCVVDSLLLYKY